MLSVRELLVTFGQGADRVTAVNRISFDVAEGEWYGLVGESGSGKSTVVRAVSGLLLDWDGAALDTLGLRGQTDRFHLLILDRQGRELGRVVQGDGPVQKQADRVLELLEAA